VQRNQPTRPAARRNDVAVCCLTDCADTSREPVLSHESLRKERNHGRLLSRLAGIFGKNLRHCIGDDLVALRVEMKVIGFGEQRAGGVRNVGSAEVSHHSDGVAGEGGDVGVLCIGTAPICRATEDCSIFKTVSVGPIGSTRVAVV